MGTTTFLTIPCIKGDIGIVPDFPGGVRKLTANSVSKVFNKEYITNIATYVSPELGTTLGIITYMPPLDGPKRVYETTLTVAAIIALDA